jgi:hypothetical protein
MTAPDQSVRNPDGVIAMPRATFLFQDSTARVTPLDYHNDNHYQNFLLMLSLVYLEPRLLA